MLNKKHKITLINTNWEPIKTNLTVDVIPRTNELLYLVELGKYFEVVRVIHQLNKKQEIVIVISEFSTPVKKIN